MSHYFLCVECNRNDDQVHFKSESVISPKQVLEQIKGTRKERQMEKKNPKEQEQTNNQEIKPKVSIRQSMDERHSRSNKMNRISELSPHAGFENGDNEILSLLNSLQAHN